MKDVISNLESFYQSGKYEEGIKFLSNHRSEFDPGIYHYNLGTFHAKNGELALGRFHFEAAKDLGFKNSMLQHNLEVIKYDLKINGIEEPSNFENWILNFSDNVSHDVLLSFFLFFLFLSIFIFNKFKSLAFPILFLLISLVPLGVKEILKKKFTKAVVVNESSLYDGPSEIYEEIGDLPKGLKLYMSLRRDESWYFIEYPEPYRGWVNYSKLNLLKEKKDVF